MGRLIDHPGAEGAKIRWALDRHRQTVAKVKAMHVDQWPWGEALGHTVKHEAAILWCLEGVGLVLSYGVAAPPETD